MSVDTERWRSVADLDSRAGTPLAWALREAAEAVDEIKHRLDRVFADDADKWEANHQMALEDIWEILNGRK